MKQRLVVTTPEADRDAKRIDQWWTRNRGAAPNLFVEELAQALALLGMETGVGLAASQSSTKPGYVNRNEQEVVRATDLPGTDHLQRVYELRCRRCEHRYGSNGSDNFQRQVSQLPRRCTWAVAGLRLGLGAIVRRS